MTLFKWKVKQILILWKKCLRNLLSLFTKLLIIYCYLTYLIPRYINLLQSSKDEAFGNIFSFTSGFRHRYH